MDDPGFFGRPKWLRYDRCQAAQAGAEKSHVRKMNSFAPTFLSAASRSKANPIALPIAAIAMAIAPALARASDGAEAGYALMIVACVPLWLIGIVVLYRQRASLLRICLFGVVPVLLGCLKPVLFPPAPGCMWANDSSAR